MEMHEVSGGGGLRLHVREWGPKSGPAILFIHGWSQSHLCWKMQWESALADEFRLVAFDCRGHGMTQAPLESEHYASPQLWADDLWCIIDQLQLARPVLVGWSYGGYVICDYLRSHGDTAIAGINFVAGAVTLNQAAFGTLIGPGFLNHVPGATAEDLPTNIAAIRSFVHACVAHPLSEEEIETALCWNMIVPPKVRLALVTRDLNNDDVLRGLTAPVLISQGRSDTVVLPAMSEHVLRTCAGAAASWYESIGHLPFLEAPDRFNRELTEFARYTASR
ncbi:alpha/beta fold hydrolase [Microvirga sp. VF16]|uniref:alpha/beta fold hydrolase n=1 Tax=Microvirga sp. VF16 TaxID=2807101 RepID=UPI00193CE5BD|nr:alpha/beta hydrolase [Microvirga sp. VF16]QRM35167.1 alpha/beta hydrolase [Microvirga sp. VF16]